MSEPSKTPFEVLGVLSTAEPEVFQAAYRAMARRYHPDRNPNANLEELNRRMGELNWAVEELTKNLKSWRERAGGPPPAQMLALPDLLILSEESPYSEFVASASGIDGLQIKAHFSSQALDVVRLSAPPELAKFAVRLRAGQPAVRPEVVEVIDMAAPSSSGTRVLVRILARNAIVMGPSDTASISPNRPTQSSSPWLQVLAVVAVATPFALGATLVLANWIK